MDVSDLTPLEQTAFLTLYARALDSRWPRPILGDKLADNVVANIDYDFAALGVTSSVVCQSALRAKMLDDRVRPTSPSTPMPSWWIWAPGWTTGCIARPCPDVCLYSVDLPAVIALRDKVLPGRDQAHSVAASLADPQWPDSIPSDRPTLLVADGLLAFLSEPVIVGLFRRITDHFRTGELAFNDYGRIGPGPSPLAIKVAPQKMFSDVASQWGYPGFRDAHHPGNLESTAEAGRGGQPRARPRGRAVPGLDSRRYAVVREDPGDGP